MPARQLRVGRHSNEAVGCVKSVRPATLGFAASDRIYWASLCAIRVAKRPAGGRTSTVVSQSPDGRAQRRFVRARPAANSTRVMR
jgi:hypothetical protein